MTTFDWRVIDDGRRFQELVGSILVHEVSKHLRPFGADGKDYCIDASYEGPYDGKAGKWIFQAKNYSDLANLKTKLTEEVARITKHLDDPTKATVGHRLWRDTSQYRLLTSVDALPQQHLDLLAILKPLKDRGIEVDVWLRSKVETLACGHPIVLQQFFGVDLPMLISPAEFRRQLLQGPLGSSYADLTFRSGKRSAEKFDQLLDSEAIVLLVVGPGGCGKTRTLIENAFRIDERPEYQAHFIQVEAETFDAQAAELNPAERHVVFVDNAPRYPHLGRLLKLATTPRFKDRLKLVLSARKSLASDIRTNLSLSLASHKRLEFEPQRLLDEGVQLAKELGHDDLVAKDISTMASGLPLWIVLGSRAIKSGTHRQDLRQDEAIQSYLKSYLQEVSGPTQAGALQLLRVLSALQPVDILNENARAMVASLMNTDVPTLVALQDLALDSGFLERRGRYVQITPDIVADSILVDALFAKDVPTDLHKRLLAGPVPDPRRLIWNLARAERLSGQTLLHDFIASAANGVADADGQGLLNTLHLLAPLSLVRPADYLDLAERIERAARRLGATANVSSAIASGAAQVYAHVGLRPRVLKLFASLEQTVKGVGSPRKMLLQALERSFLQNRLAIAEHLPVLRSWWNDPDEALQHLATQCLEVSLKLELNRETFRGVQITFEIFHLLPTDPLVQGRKASLDLLSEFIYGAGPSKRRLLVQLLDNSIREASLEHRRTEDTPPIRAYFASQISMLFDLVEKLVQAEGELLVLSKIVHCLDWQRRFGAPPLSTRAGALIAIVEARPGYSLFKIIATHSFDDKEEDVARAAADVVRDLAPEDFLDILSQHAKAASGRGMSLLFEIGRLDETYGRKLLDLYWSKAEYIPEAFAAYLAAALRIFGTDQELLWRLAEQGPRSRRVSAMAAGRIRPAWYSGFRLTDKDWELMERIAEDPDPSVHRALSSMLRLFVTSETGDAERALRVAKHLAMHDLDVVGEEVAEVLREVLQQVPSLEPTVRDSFRWLLPAKSLDQYWIAWLMNALGRSDPGWLFDFFKERSRRGLDPLPPRLLTQQVGPPPGRDALKALLLGAVGTMPGTRGEAFLSGFTRWLIGPRVTGDLIAVASEVLTGQPTANTIEALAYSLAQLEEDEAKYAVAGGCLMAAQSLGPVQQERVGEVVGDVLDPGVISWQSGTVPAALAREDELLEWMALSFPDSRSVAAFVQEAKAAVRARIQGILDDDDDW